MVMDVLILGAGYGTRMVADIEKSENHQHLKGVPKPLLSIGGKPLVSHWMDIILAVDNSIINRVFIVTNLSNHKKFEEWKEAHQYSQVELVCEGSTCNEERSGAVACIELVIKKCDVQHGLIVIAGDTLFYKDFSLSSVLDVYVQKQQEKDQDSSLVVHSTCTDEEIHKRGIIELNDESKVVGFLEKPQATDTTSRTQCPCFYVLSLKSVRLVSKFLQEYKDAPLKARDATGNFVNYLYQRVPVYATPVSGRFDVGGLQTYLECDQYFTEAQT